MKADEKSVVRDLFLENFTFLNDKKMALYGVGPNTKAILDIADNFSIIGLLDEHLVGEELWGYPVLTWKDVKETKVEIIVIVANAASTKVIFKRIKNQVQENNIILYDVNGNHLLDKDEIKVDKNNTYFISEKAATLGDHIALGLFIKKAFNNPFILHGTEGKMKIKSAYDFAYLFVAPVVTKFIYWLIQRLREEKSDCILFAARDGYLIKKLYDYYIDNKSRNTKGMAKSIYFLTSRSASVLPSIKCENDILEAAEFYSGNVMCMLQERFHLSEDEIIDYSKSNRTDISNYILEHKDVILKHAQEELGNYKTYLAQLNLEKYNNIIFFDMMSRGTCQYALKKIGDINTIGLYMYYRDYGRNKSLPRLQIKGMYNESSLYGGDSYFSYLFPFLEIILSSPKPTVHSFDCNGDPIYGNEVRTQKQINMVKEMQGAVLDYFQEFERLTDGNQSLELSLEYVDAVLGMASAKHTEFSYGEELIFDNLYEGRNTALKDFL